MGDLREEVRERYAAAARVVPDGMAANDAPEVGGCCPPEEGLGVRFYDTTERSALPAEAVLASLGCGNPTVVAELREGETVLDLGSGGGFPGAVMAIILQDREGARIDLVESNRKKAAFLQTALGRYRDTVRVHARRIEDAYELVRQPEIVTARALAPLSMLLNITSPWLMAGATGLFHKGRDYRGEVKESRDGWNLDLVEHESRIDPESVILEIRNLRPR